MKFPRALRFQYVAYSSPRDRWLSVTFGAALLWYLFCVPALRLSADASEVCGIPARGILEPRHSRDVADPSGRASENAIFELEKKVYPEIEARISETNEWLFRKFTLAGGLLIGFFVEVWVKVRGVPGSSRHAQRIEALMSGLLSSPATSAVLGLSCLISLFIDLHIRRGLVTIQQLGVWASACAGPFLAVPQVGFLPWERFIRSASPQGMHAALIDSIQAASLGCFTIVIFVFYYWAFQAVCLKGIDPLNRIVSALLIWMLFLFYLGSHIAPPYVSFVAYEEWWFPTEQVDYFGALLVLIGFMTAWQLMPSGQSAEGSS